MSFTQLCFIRKNTPEIIHKLEELGYSSHIFNNNDGNNIYVDKSGTYISADIEDSYYIDCGTNEELFLALAGLRDDNDVNQLFYYEGKLVVCVQDFSSTLNIYNDKFYKVKLFDNKNILFEVPFKKLRKCTVEEIIEHFKN